MKPSEKDLEEARAFVDNWGVYDGPDTAERVAPTFARIRTEGYRDGLEAALEECSAVYAKVGGWPVGECRDRIRALKGDDE